jgi:hypothetical protein
MDEISTLRETFDPGTPSPAAEHQARAALQDRIDGTANLSGRRSRSHRNLGRRFAPIAVGMATAAAVTAAFAINGGGHRTTPDRPAVQPAAQPTTAALPHPHPVGAAQVMENAAWAAEREKWTAPAPTQFMYLDLITMSNQPAYAQEHPNGALLPGKAAYREGRSWQRIDGQVQGYMKNGKLVTVRQGQNGGYWSQLEWSVITGLTTPAKVRAWVANPGVMGVDPHPMLSEYVLPPVVKAAVLRYLAGLPGKRLDAGTVTVDGHRAIIVGWPEEGYLSRELLFDPQTYALVGDRLIATADHTGHGDDGTSVTHKGDLLRQALYHKMIIVDQAGDTD